MIPFYRPYFDHREILAALRPGPGREEFESALAVRLGARHGVAFAYGRSGIIATLRALDLDQAEVVIPAYTCVVIAQAVVASGNQPVFVDIDLADYNMNTRAIERALTPQTKAVIVTHLYGYPADVDAIRALLGDERIIIIEDRAQCLFTPFSERAQLRGDVGLCSLGPNKQLSTVQGGVIITHSSDLDQRIRDYRDREMSQPSTRTWIKRWVWFAASYGAFRRPLYGLLQRAGFTGRDSLLSKRLDSSQSPLPDDYATAYMDFQGRIGLAQLHKADTIMATRRKLAELYDDELSNVPGLNLPPKIPGSTYAYYTLRIHQRDQVGFGPRMLAQGVAVDRVYDYALPYLAEYRRYARGDYPAARQAAYEVTNLPLYPHLSTSSVRYIAACARRAAQERFAFLTP